MPQSLSSAEEKSGVVLQNYVSVAVMFLHNKVLKRATMYLLYMFVIGRNPVAGLWGRTLGEN